MIVSILAAMSDDRVIGWQGKLPWHIPADLTRFRTLTTGHTVVMGRRTYQSIGHPLEGRNNIVVSRRGEPIEGCLVVPSLEKAIDAAGSDDEVFICGGADIYREAFAISQRVYLTQIHAKYPGDVFFPEMPGDFIETFREEFPDAIPPISFVVYEKAERSETATDADGLRRKGIEALQRKLYFLARNCFEESLSLRESDEVSSYLAFCMAKCGSDRMKALRIAEDALRRDPDNLSLYLNLGRVQMLAGAKEQGLDTLRKGLHLGGGKEFTDELNGWGTRKAPPIKSLPRSHPINKYLGKVLHRLGLR